MIRINLLPHREEKRKSRRQQFILFSALAALGGLLVWFIGHSIIAGYVDGQDEKNAMLKQEIALLDKEISEIKGLREQAEALLSRKQVIESLQTNRTEPVHVFNELARQIPDHEQMIEGYVTELHPVGAGFMGSLATMFAGATYTERISN